MAVDNTICEELPITTFLTVRSLMPSNSWRIFMQWGVQMFFFKVRFRLLKYG
jgi:hypothetical protein